MMGTEGLSAGDILALTKDNDNGMSGAWNNPFIYLVWLALLGGNGGLFGNRNADAAVQGALTRSDLFEGFNWRNYCKFTEKWCSSARSYSHSNISFGH